MVRYKHQKNAFIDELQHQKEKYGKYNMTTGKLTGVGAGPGDPEHITLKGLKAIRMADVLMLPAKSREECRAYMIAKEACGIFNREYNANINIEDKECMFEPFPMSMDKQALCNFHTNVADKISSLVKKGKHVVFLAIGDPCIYSTFHYIASIIKDKGYETEWINGISSFCASAARLGISLAQNNEPIHIIPGKYDLNDLKALKGTKVIMKPSRTDPDFRAYIEEVGSQDGCSVYWVSECGLPGERIAYEASGIPEDMGYMSVVIIRDEFKTAKNT
jgi:precorrin-2 C(20)-methyltransferase